MSTFLLAKQSRSLLHTLVLPFVLMGLFGAEASTSRAQPKKTERKAAPKPAPKKDVPIVLSVAAVLNEPGPTVAFTVTNKGKTDIPDLEPGQDPSRVFVVKPNGEEVKFGFSAGPPAPGTKPRVVAPNESKTYKMNVFVLFGMLNLKDAGVYRLYWARSQQQGDSVVIYKSNEIPILREPGTPTYNPSTGAADPE